MPHNPFLFSIQCPWVTTEASKFTTSASTTSDAPLILSVEKIKFLTQSYIDNAKGKGNAHPKVLLYCIRVLDNDGGVPKFRALAYVTDKRAEKVFEHVMADFIQLDFV